MTRSFYFVLLLLFIFLSACNNGPCVRGGGQLQDYDLGFTDFNSISIEGGIDLVLTQGPEYSTILEVEPEIFAIMKTQVSNDVLYIGTRNNCINSSRGITLFVTAPDFEYFEVSGSSSITSTNELDLDFIDVQVSGSGYVSLSGMIDEQMLDVSGSLKVENFDVSSNRVVIRVSGSGDFDVTALEEMDVRVSGSARIRYQGEPQITQSVSGSLDLEKVD